MLNLTNYAKDAAKGLRKLLDSVIYDLPQRGQLYLFSAMVNSPEFEELLDTFPDKNRFCYSLFLLGKTLPYESVEKLLGKENVNSLIEIGLLRDTGEGIKTDGYVILPFQGGYFLTKISACSLTDYLGMMAGFDSQLSELLSPLLTVEKKDRVLELNTHLGSRAILNSRLGGTAVAITNNFDNADLAKFNVLLNGMEDKVEVRTESCPFQITGEDKFDIIYLHLPFWEFPFDLEYFYSKKRKGGLDNFKDLSNLEDFLNKHLASCGRVVISGQALGKEDYPFLITDFNCLFQNKGWNIQLSLENRITAGMFAYLSADISAKMSQNYNSTEELSDKLNRLLTEDTQVEYLYFFTLNIGKDDCHSKTHIFNLCNKWSKSDRPLLKEGLEFKSSQPMYMVSRQGSELAEVDEETLDFLKMCDGKCTLAELAKTCAAKHNKSSPFGIERVLMDALGICRFLKQKGILQ